MLYALGWLFGYTYLWFNVYILGISLYFPSFYMYRLRFLCSSIHYVRQSAKEMPIFFYSGYSFHCRCFLYVVLYFFAAYLLQQIRFSVSLFLFLQYIGFYAIFLLLIVVAFAASILWYPTEYLFIGKRNKKAKLKNEDK